MSPSLTDYARLALICVLREFAWGDMLRSHLSLVSVLREFAQGGMPLSATKPGLEIMIKLSKH